MMYVDSTNGEDDTTVGQSSTSINHMMEGHVPVPYFSFNKNEITS